MRAWSCLLVAAFLMSCTKETAVPAPTQVMLRISSHDDQLLRAYDKLRVAVSLREGDIWKTPAVREFPPAALRWPVDIPITPRVRADAFKQFEVVVEARRADEVLAQARVITGFLPDQRRVLPLDLFACSAQLGKVCTTHPDCHGMECLVCDLSGSCVDVPEVSPNDLDPWSSSSPETDMQPSTREPASIDDDADSSRADAGKMDSAVAVAVAEDGALPVVDVMPPTPADGSGLGVDAQTAREFALGISGDPCSSFTEGSSGCEGHASLQPLTCKAGVWLAQPRCLPTERCESKAGPDQGSCRSVPAACRDKPPGNTCDGAARVECGVDLVTISVQPCPANSHCDPAAPTQCLCDAGYTTDKDGKCVNPNDCPTGACPGGTCVDGLGDYTCNCGEGFTGTGTKGCSQVFYCPKNACAPGGSCIDAVNWSCSCLSGFSGSGTQACANIDDCPSTKCKSPGGTCRDGVNQYTCECSPGFSGTDCQNDICNPNPCRNGGTCARTGTLCVCPSGFSGTNCQTDVCSPNPCKNGGTCNRSGQLCTCQAGYTGANCETDACAPNPCQNGGLCSRTPQGAACSCASGYSGSRCETDINDCAGNPCGTDNLCTDKVNDYACTCTTNYFRASAKECVPKFVDVVTGRYYSCARRSDGSVSCWGDNTSTIFGSTQLAESSLPVVVDTIKDATTLSSTGRHACSRRSSGNPICWGRNDSGQVGIGNLLSFIAPPALVNALSNATQISAGTEHTCARLVDGTVLCAGNNEFGQLGDGTTNNSNTFVAVAGLSNVVEVSAGEDHTCARKTDNTVVCWGYNAGGQLGDGTIINSSIPVPVRGVSSVAQVVARGDRSCARKSDLSVVCWGVHPLSNGQLGSSPWTVSGLSDVAEISLGHLHECARLVGGNVVCWGFDNGRGQIGNGTTSPSFSPVTISLPAAATAISAGYDHTCARLSSGAVYCWGNNDYGQLGDGTVNEAHSPVAVRAF